MPHFLGLDCGGSSSRAIVVDGRGSVLFEGRAGPANLVSTPRQDLVQNLLTALDGAPSVDFAVGCFAGLVSPNESSVAVSALRQAGVRCPIEVRPDYWAALAACPKGTATVVIAGTGSVIASWAGKAKVRKTGGGGPLLGDLGSAFDVGRRALRAVVVDEWAAPTGRFSEALIRTFGSGDPGEVVSSVGSSPDPAARVASLAPVIGADAGDRAEYAAFAVEGAMADLAESVRRHGPPQVGLSVAGGLWDAHPVFLTVFRRALAIGNESGPPVRPLGQYHVERLKVPPASGAARLARLLFHEH